MLTQIAKHTLSTPILNVCANFLALAYVNPKDVYNSAQSLLIIASTDNHDCLAPAIYYIHLHSHRTCVYISTYLCGNI